MWYSDLNLFRYFFTEIWKRELGSGERNWLKTPEFLLSFFSIDWPEGDDDDDDAKIGLRFDTDILAQPLSCSFETLFAEFD